MPVYIHPANLIIPKQTIEEKYEGGIEQFREDFRSENEMFQEDVELFCFARWNPDEFPVDVLIAKGLEYDKQKQWTNDYVIVVRYGGCLWEVDWLEAGEIYAYHQDCSLNHKAQAIQMEKITVDEISRIFEAGGNPFETIK